MLEKYQKSYNIKNSAPLIALDMGTHQYQNFLGCMSIVDGIVCKYVLQYLSTGIIEKDINSSLGLFSKFWAHFNWGKQFSAHICLCLCFKWILKSQCIHWSKLILHSSNLLGKSGKICHEKKFSALRLHSTWINYSIKYSLGTGAQLML